jgi:hypothetical protein
LSSLCSSVLAPWRKILEALRVVLC